MRRDDVPPPAQIVDVPPTAAPAVQTQPKAGPAASSYRLLAIDDDPQVTKALLNEFSGRFASVSTANTVADALPEIEGSPPGLVVASDLIIARSDGGGILGGIEVLEQVRGLQPDVPVILFSDYENAEAEERANRLGVSAFLMKPRKAQIQAGKDAGGASPAMREFLASLGEALAPYLGAAGVEATARAETGAAQPGEVRGEADEPPAAESVEGAAGTPMRVPAPAPPAAEAGPTRAEAQGETSTGWDSIPGRADSVQASGLYDLRTEIAGDLDAIDVPGAADLPPASPLREPVGTLRSMLAELLDPANRDTVTLLVLRFASQVFERAALFLVTRRAYVGLGGFSAMESSDRFVARVRRVHVPIEVESVLSTVAKYRSSYRGPLSQADGNRQLIDGLGGPWPSSHVAALPLISGDRVAAILYGDNTEESELAPTDTLEIFLQQAGLAMDRTLLERRLEERRRPDDE
jgi:CheY-like chemotaxis protein